MLSIFAAYKLILAKAIWKKCLALFPLVLLFIIIYGFTWGFWQLNVREVTYESNDIPEAFDGYKIVQVTDVHTGGSFWGPYNGLLKDGVEKINSLNPDLICMVGDLQTLLPTELEPFKEEFSSLKAKDGVLTVMGNHDYCSYARKRTFLYSPRQRQHSRIGRGELGQETLPTAGRPEKDPERAYPKPKYQDSRSADIHPLPVARPECMEEASSACYQAEHYSCRTYSRSTVRNLRMDTYKVCL